MTQANTIRVRIEVRTRVRVSNIGAAGEIWLVLGLYLGQGYIRVMVTARVNISVTARAN